MKREAQATWIHANCLHIETSLGIVNIYTGLHDTEGRKVESVEIMPDKVDHTVKVEDSDYLRVRMIEVKV